MINGKIWGTTELLFNHNNVECHRIKIKAGMASSWHTHTCRQNSFYVMSGKLAIQSCKNDYKLTDTTIIKDGESTYVPPGEKHRFVALTDVDAIEYYWVDLINTDIKRNNHGGPISNEEFKKLLQIT
jgi:mannose-6-phosphate isomerase-like protein (cupin superfamily)